MNMKFEQKKLKKLKTMRIGTPSDSEEDSVKSEDEFQKHFLK